MKILICFFILWICQLQAITAKWENRHQALAIAHYVKADKYVICDAEQARKIVDSLYLVGYEDVFSGIGFCCGSKDTNGGNLMQPLFINSVYTADDVIFKQKICEVKPLATLIHEEGFRYNIGFTIRDSELYLTNRNLRNLTDTVQGKQRFALMNFAFDVDKLQTYEARHTLFLYRHSGRYTKKCKKYDDSVYDQSLRRIDAIDLGKFYSHDRQDVALQGLKRPDINLPETNNLVEKIKNNYKQTVIYYEYFRMHQLIPIDDYTDKVSQAATCSYINTIPVWKYISKGILQKVEIFIRKLANRLPMDTLDITTSTHQVLKLREEDDRGEKEVYLDIEGGKIPVPEIIKKTITYRVPSAETNSGDTINNLYMVIWIYNVVPTSDIVHFPCQDICEENGWSITAEPKERNAMFCCPMESSQLESEPKVLNLKEVPQQIDNNGEVHSIDVTLTTNPK